MNDLKSSFRSLEETQALLAQILHDIISPFSSLSAGLDLLPKPQDEIGKLVFQARDQLYTQLILSRFIFSYGEGTYEEGLQVFLGYAQGLKLEIQGDLPQEGNLKIVVGLAFWIMRQCRARSGATLICGKEPFLFQLRGSLIRPETREDWVLQGVVEGQSSQESYAVYLNRLLRANHQKVVLERSPESLSLRLENLTHRSSRGL